MANAYTRRILSRKALDTMNSTLQQYPLLRDIKRLERAAIAERAALFGKKVLLLDVGCGLGEDMRVLKGRVNGGIVGIDANPLAIRDCSSGQGLYFLPMDAKEMGFRDGTFDLSYLTVNTLGNFGLLERYLWVKEMLRVSHLSFISLYMDTGDPEEMRIEDRLDYYRTVFLNADPTWEPDMVFDGKRFRSDSVDWTGRLFTLEEIKEMLRIYGIQDYRINRLSEILLGIEIPAQIIAPAPDMSEVRLLAWDK